MSFIKVAWHDAVSTHTGASLSNAARSGAHAPGFGCLRVKIHDGRAVDIRQGIQHPHAGSLRVAHTAGRSHAPCRAPRGARLRA